MGLTVLDHMEKLIIIFFQMSSPIQRVEAATKIQRFWRLHHGYILIRDSGNTTLFFPKTIAQVELENFNRKLSLFISCYYAGESTAKVLSELRSIYHKLPPQHAYSIKKVINENDFLRTTFADLF